MIVKLISYQMYIMLTEKLKFIYWRKITYKFYKKQERVRKCETLAWKYESKKTF